MNLADAIRSAALRAEPVENPVVPPYLPLSVIQTTVSETPTDLEDGLSTSVSFGSEATEANENETPVASPVHTTFPPTTAMQNTTRATVESADVPAVNGVGAPGTVVRLELFLGPEQLHSLLQVLGNTQHSVLTVREAASYLRMSPSRLEVLAQEHQIPAFLIDGKWKFSKAGLDEWLGLQSNQLGSSQEKGA